MRQIVFGEVKPCRTESAASSFRPAAYGVVSSISSSASVDSTTYCLAGNCQCGTAVEPICVSGTDLPQKSWFPSTGKSGTPTRLNARTRFHCGSADDPGPHG